MRKDTTYSSKGKINHRDIAALNTYGQNTRAQKFIKEILLQLKSHVDLHTVTVDDLNQKVTLKKIRPKGNYCFFKKVPLCFLL